MRLNEEMMQFLNDRNESILNKLRLTFMNDL